MGAPFDLRGGEIFIIASQACWSWYSITAQRWLLGCSQIRITTMTTVTASATLIGVYLLASLLGAGRFPPAVPPTAFDYGPVHLACAGAGDDRQHSLALRRATSWAR